MNVGAYGSVAHRRRPQYQRWAGLVFWFRLCHVQNGAHIVNVKSKVKRTILRSPVVARYYLKKKWGSPRDLPMPKARSYNSTLKTQQEWQQAVAEVRDMRLIECKDTPKNWDSLAALYCILERTQRSAKILDAGAELYSVILPWLYVYGYQSLTGINLTFDHPIHMGPITYEPGDITSTRFKAATFDAVTCMSVVEHGVDLRIYFKEMARVLKPGGVLITSTDYFDEAIDTGERETYGAPVHIYSKREIEESLAVAVEYNLYPTGGIDLECRDKPVEWHRMDLNYTFLIFALEKR